MNTITKYKPYKLQKMKTMNLKRMCCYCQSNVNKENTNKKSKFNIILYDEKILYPDYNFSL